jgi:hypothetical protein
MIAGTQIRTLPIGICAFDIVGVFLVLLKKHPRGKEVLRVPRLLQDFKNGQKLVKGC